MTYLKPPKLCFLRSKPRLAPSMMCETVILSIAAALWIWSGGSTWTDLIGKPRDAPFLMIPGHIRAVFFWWLPALYALWSSRTHKRVTGAFFALSIGPIVRLASYFVSWIVSWPLVDPLVPDSDLKGDPRAWGSGWLYAAILVGLAGFTYLCALMRRYEAKIVRLETEAANLRITAAKG